MRLRQGKKIYLIIVIFCCVANAQNSYFPPKTFDEKPDLDNFVNTWYSGQLRALEEPSLFSLSKKEAAQSYRFLWLRTFHHPVSIRLEIQPDGSGILTEKMASGAGGYKPGRLIENRTISIPAERTQTFLRHLDAASFWTMPVKDDRSGCDGSEWIIEGVRNQKYRLVERWTPERGPVHDLGWELAFDLAGLKIAKDQLY